jgi:hypothetical protein
VVAFARDQGDWTTISLLVFSTDYGTVFVCGTVATGSAIQDSVGIVQPETEGIDQITFVTLLHLLEA